MLAPSFWSLDTLRSKHGHILDGLSLGSLKVSLNSVSSCSFSSRMELSTNSCVNIPRYAQPTGQPTPSLLLHIPSQARRGSHSGDDVPSNFPRTITPVCQVEIDTADSTAQDIFQNSDSDHLANQMTSPVSR
jgi:hypothetical protein